MGAAGLALELSGVAITTPLPQSLLGERSSDALRSAGEGARREVKTHLFNCRRASLYFFRVSVTVSVCDWLPSFTVRVRVTDFTQPVVVSNSYSVTSSI